MKTGIIVSSLLWLGVAVAASGCAVSGTTGDYVELRGTPRGVEAFADMTNGLIRTGKESPERNSEYFAHRGTQERELTARKGQAVGFWQKLVN